ncbi:hypothetical protein [Geobacillus sp. Y412MC52]|uniref:hypothetical protein n=1 Tax=Geobacillus sp. (strain Y412MC52) TaxID=550542 RepID=UPI0001B9EEE7|nr:hypothetical protein [Geobacillus sp. Y412MC52]ADU95281.1 hypothetical protein GYMC52_2914 [Geobacillus sp. Y412MC52]
MATTPKRLYIGQPGTTIGALYQVPATYKTIVKNIILCNTTGTDAKIDIYFVPSGNGASAANKVISQYTVSANDTAVINLSAVLGSGDVISAAQVTANAITVYISGVEVS